MSSFKVWMAQIRGNFLILSVFLVLIGLAFAIKYPQGSEFNFLHAVLLVIGVVLAHASVNLFNEYSDYHTKIDFKTNRTPFSGGSGMLTSGLTTPGEVLIAAIATLLIPLAIGIYFAIISHWTIIVISLIGTFSIVFYTNFLAKLLLGELFAGLALGSLVIVGTYIAMTANPGMQFGSIVPPEVEWLSVPPGILTGLLLFINEFPDREADLEGGRNHLVIRLGKKKAAWLYSACMVVTFAIIMILPVVGLSSYWIYLALFPIPFAVKASVTAVRFGDNYSKMVPALGSNVVAVLLTDLLLAVAIFIEVL